MGYILLMAKVSKALFRTRFSKFKEKANNGGVSERLLEAQQEWAKELMLRHIAEETIAHCYTVYEGVLARHSAKEIENDLMVTPSGKLIESDTGFISKLSGTERRATVEMTSIFSYGMSYDKEAQIGIADVLAKAILKNKK